MTNGIQLLQRFRIGALVGIYWAIAAAAPFILFGSVARPDVATAVLFIVVASYFSYTGYRAWKLQWKARFLIRVVVPAVLFSVALIVVGVFKWLA